MSLYDKGDPVQIEKFRGVTNRGVQILNVNVIPAREMCVRCGVRRTRATGKETAKGFVCHGCHTKRPNQ